jgi:signal transduction histidine kinase
MARFHAGVEIGSLLGAQVVPKALAPVAPLLEIVVPLRGRRDPSVVGFAHYWMDGARVQEKFADIDRGLAWQAGVILVMGATGLAAVSGWALRRLAAANRRLAEQGEDLERANRELVLAAKTSAIGAISAHLIHGLKNPLDGLEGFVADAAPANGAPADSEAWREAAETTRRLRTLVQDVIAVLRDEAAQAGSPVALRDVIHGVLHKFACDAERNDVQLTTIAEPPDIQLDSRVAHLAGLVLANLIGNAVEASPRGSRVTFAAEVTPHEIEFQVADRGPGLPAAVRKNLFRPLNSTKPGGSGIGLAISQQLARHVGGRLELVSSSAEGTTFRFVVPQA